MSCVFSGSPVHAKIVCTCQVSCIKHASICMCVPAHVYVKFKLSYIVYSIHIRIDMEISVITSLGDKYFKEKS